MKLAPCPSCARHVRVDEGACPFCRSVFAAPLTPVANPIRNRRIAAIAIAAGLTAASCVPPPPTDDAGQNQALYGAPPPDDSGTVADTDAGGPVPAYGLPAFDAGPPVDSGGGPAPAYGGPPPQQDSGVVDDTDGGGAVPAYGIAPPPDSGA